MRIKIPKITPVVQKESFDCGPAAVATLLKIVGREDLAREDIYERLGTSAEIGTRIDKIGQFLLSEGIKIEEKVGATMLDLENKIKEGKVCLVDYQAWGTEKEKNELLCGHYCVVFGVDEKEIYMFDPSIETELETGLGIGVVKISKEAFDKRWVDKEVTGEVYDHWMIAVRTS